MRNRVTVLAALAVALPATAQAMVADTAPSATPLILWDDPGRDPNRLPPDRVEAAFIADGEDPAIVRPLFRMAREHRCRLDEVHQGEIADPMASGNGHLLHGVVAMPALWPAGVTHAAIRCRIMRGDEMDELVQPLVCNNYYLVRTPLGAPPALPPIEVPFSPPFAGGPGIAGPVFGGNEEASASVAAGAFGGSAGGGSEVVAPGTVGSSGSRETTSRTIATKNLVYVIRVPAESVGQLPGAELPPSVPTPGASVAPGTTSAPPPIQQSGAPTPLPEPSSAAAFAASLGLLTVMGRMRCRKCK
jgi:hypothetical protein